MFVQFSDRLLALCHRSFAMFPRSHISPHFQSCFKASTWNHGVQLVFRSLMRRLLWNCMILVGSVCVESDGRHGDWNNAFRKSVNKRISTDKDSSRPNICSRVCIMVLKFLSRPKTFSNDLLGCPKIEVGRGRGWYSNSESLITLSNDAFHSN